MGVVAVGQCDQCGKIAHDMRRFDDEWICRRCMDAAGIDEQWIKDYQQALIDIERELGTTRSTSARHRGGRFGLLG